MVSHRNFRGFTIIELMVVIVIIGVLSTFAMISVTRARALSLETKARGDLKQLRTAIEMLEADTGRWPNGCRPWATANPEIDLNNAQAGLVAKPSVGNQGTGCIWDASTLKVWDGPYIQNTRDPWGHAYWFDPDYYPYQNCGSKPAESLSAVIESYGPDGTGMNSYDCDDIFLKLVQ